MSRKTNSQMKEIWKQEDERKEAALRLIVHRQATKRLLTELQQVRTSSALGFKNESTFQYSHMLKASVLCGVRYEILTITGTTVIIEISHYSGDQFWIIFESTKFFNERVFLCKVKFKHLTKVLEFFVPLFKEL